MNEIHPDGENTYIIQEAERYAVQMKLIGEWIAKKEGAIRVLDVGCYPGHLAMLLRHYCDAEVTGVGITNNQLFTRRMWDCKIDFKRQDVEKERLPFPGGYFDLVLFTEVIEHLFNPFLIGKEMARVLKNNGALLLSTPNAASLRSRICLAQGKISNPLFFSLADQVYSDESGVNEYPTHVRMWMPSELKLFLSKIGLTAVSEKYLDFPSASPDGFKERIMRWVVKLFPASYHDLVTMFAVKKQHTVPSTVIHFPGERMVPGQEAKKP
jgi:SAM-dependent methyltransferase